MRDFFVSYNHRDRVWAEWIAWTLEEKGHTAVIQAWDFRPGSNFVLEMQKAASDTRQTIMVLSQAYLDAEYTKPEWAAAFREDPCGEARKLIPVRVGPCKPVGLLGSVIYIDLVGLSAEEAAAALTEGLAERAKPEAKPAFPGGRVAAEVDSRVARREVPYPGTGTPLPRQLPPPPADFIGRELELKELRPTADAGATVAIFSLRGMGGVGKTALALKLAEELAPLYPDGQTFLDLQGVKAQQDVTAPLSPAQAMAHVIRSFLPEARVPDTEAELAGLYRSVLRGRRVLLLMDNAAGREQVEPLIPPAACALLVTSRIHFHLPGAATQDLGTLPEADARAMLLGIAPRIGAEAGEIDHLCGCLPFALRLAGSALADRPDLTPADYARSLARAERRFGPVNASLDLSLKLIREESQRLWCRLAVFPGTFNLEAAAAVWEMEVNLARDAIGEMVTASLVEWESGRYRLHDLARLFAYGRLNDEESTAARCQHAVHYLEVLRKASTLYQVGGAALLEGLRLFAEEWPNVQAGQAWTAANIGSTERAASLCNDYPDAGRFFLSLRLHPHERIRWSEAALGAARKLGDRVLEGFHLGNLGTAYAHLGEPRRAVAFHEEHLAIAREIGNRLSEGYAFGSLGNDYAYLGEPRRAIDCYEQWLAIARENGDRRGEANALGSLGLAHVDLGEPRRALGFFEQHLTIAREIGDRRSEGNALSSLGDAYADLGKPRRAIDFYEQQLAIAREIGDRRGEGYALANLGLAYANLGEPRRAIDFFEQGLAIARELGNRHSEASTVGSLGLAYAALGEPRRAIECFEQHLAIAGETGERDGVVMAGWNLGLVYEAEGDLKKAVSLMQPRIDYEREIGHQDAEEHAARVEALRARAGGTAEPGSMQAQESLEPSPR